MVAISRGPDDAPVGEALELVRDGLGAHAHRLGEVRDAELTGPGQGVQQAEACVVREDSEQLAELIRLRRRHERAPAEGRLRGPTPRP